MIIQQVYLYRQVSKGGRGGAGACPMLFYAKDSMNFTKEYSAMASCTYLREGAYILVSKAVILNTGTHAWSSIGVLI